MQKQDLIDFHSAAIALGLNHPEISMIQIQDLVELTQSDLDIVLNSKIVKFYITPAVENLAASLSYSLTASDYEGSLTTNALTKSTIIAILDMIVE
jgi:hypothetical protein